MVRSALAKVKPIFGCTAIWLKSSITISMGSSMLEMFTWGLLRYCSEE